MIEDLRLIKVIKTVAMRGSVSAAAEDLGISQPALTKKIQAIESEVQLSLFKRDARGVSLTENGEFFLKQSENLFVEAKDFSNRLKAFREGNGGELRIGTKTGLDDVFFTKVMLEFISNQPSALLEVDIDTTPSLTKRLLSGELDLVLVARGYPDKSGQDCLRNPDITFIDLCALKFNFAVRNDHPVLETENPIHHIFEYPLACPKAPVDILNQIAHAQREAGASYPCPNILIDDYSAVFKVLESSNHWTAVPRASEQVVEGIKTLRLIPDEETIPPLFIGYATRTNWDLIPSAERFIDLVENAVSELPESAVCRQNSMLNRP